MSNRNDSGDFPVVGVVDVGSNSIKLTVARPTSDGGIDYLAGASETVRLGAGLANTGELAPDRIEAALVTLQVYAKTARELGAVRLVGVATEATRQATNGPAFLERVRTEVCWDLRIISGDEEAELTFRGLATDVDLTGMVVVADVGGGSTEVIVATDGNVTQAESIRLGSGTLTERLVNSDPPTSDELIACSGAASDKLTGVSLPSDGSARLIVIGGTGEYLARLVPDVDRISSAVINGALQRCQTATSAQLALEIGIQQARARVLPAGVAIVRALVDRLSPDRVEVAQSGIRTGLLLATFAELAAESKVTGQ